MDLDQAFATYMVANSAALTESTDVLASIGAELSDEVPVCDQGTGDYATIQAAIDAAHDGRVIHVSRNLPGNLILSGKVLELMGVDGPEATIIDGQLNGKCLILSNADGSEVSGFTFTRGNAKPTRTEATGSRCNSPMY